MSPHACRIRAIYHGLPRKTETFYKKDRALSFFIPNRTRDFYLSGCCVYTGVLRQWLSHNTKNPRPFAISERLDTSLACPLLPVDPVTALLSATKTSYFCPLFCSPGPGDVDKCQEAS